MELKEKRFIIDELSDTIRYYKLLVKTQSLLYDTILKKTEELVAASEKGEAKRKDIVEIDFCNRKNAVMINEFMKATSVLNLLYRQVIFFGIDKEIDKEIIQFVQGVIAAPGADYMLAEKDGIAEFKDNQIRNSLFDFSDQNVMEEDIPSILQSIKEQYLDFKKNMANEENKETETK